MSFRFCCVIVLFYSNVLSQERFSFKKLSFPEKCWVVSHPFVTKKTFKLTRLAITETNIVSKEIFYDYGSGSHADAFRHALWMGLLCNEIGSRRALKLGNAHEKGNYLQFKKGITEDGILPDSVSCIMDIFNNKMGVEIGMEIRKKGNKDKIKDRMDIRNMVIEKIKGGEMRVIRKDKKGNFLDCRGEIIDMQKWKDKWGIPKCMVRSGAL